MCIIQFYALKTINTMSWAHMYIKVTQYLETCNVYSSALGNNRDSNVRFVWSFLLFGILINCVFILKDDTLFSDTCI